MTKNHQPIEKVAKDEDCHKIDVHSIFYTIQGEGPFSGRPAVFIRLAGCNLQCPLCDTQYTEGRETMPVANVLARVYALASKILRPVVVITGGEPMRQPKGLGGLLAVLCTAGYETQIETNGVLPPPDISKDYGLTFKTFVDGQGPYIIISPKTDKVNADVEARALAYKYVLMCDSVDSDGLPIQALENKVKRRVARPPSWWDRGVYVQPADTGYEVLDAMNRAAVVTASLNHGHTAQLQIHKILGLE